MIHVGVVVRRDHGQHVQRVAHAPDLADGIAAEDAGGHIGIRHDVDHVVAAERLDGHGAEGRQAGRAVVSVDTPQAVQQQVAHRVPERNLRVRQVALKPEVDSHRLPAAGPRIVRAGAAQRQGIGVVQERVVVQDDDVQVVIEIDVDDGRAKIVVGHLQLAGFRIGGLNHDVFGHLTAPDRRAVDQQVLLQAVGLDRISLVEVYVDVPALRRVVGIGTNVQRVNVVAGAGSARGRVLVVAVHVQIGHVTEADRRAAVEHQEELVVAVDIDVVLWIRRCEGGVVGRIRRQHGQRREHGIHVAPNHDEIVGLVNQRVVVVPEHVDRLTGQARRQDDALDRAPAQSERGQAGDGVRGRDLHFGRIGFVAVDIDLARSDHIQGIAVGSEARHGVAAVDLHREVPGEHRRNVIGHVVHRSRAGRVRFIACVHDQALVQRVGLYERGRRDRRGDPPADRHGGIGHPDHVVGGRRGRGMQHIRRSGNQHARPKAKQVIRRRRVDQVGFAGRVDVQLVAIRSDTAAVHGQAGHPVQAHVRTGRAVPFRDPRQSVGKGLCIRRAVPRIAAAEHQGLVRRQRGDRQIVVRCRTCHGRRISGAGAVVEERFDRIDVEHAVVRSRRVGAQSGDVHVAAARSGISDPQRPGLGIRVHCHRRRQSRAGRSDQAADVQADDIAIVGIGSDFPAVDLERGTRRDGHAGVGGKVDLERVVAVEAVERVDRAGLDGVSLNAERAVVPRAGDGGIAVADRVPSGARRIVDVVAVQRGQIVGADQFELGQGVDRRGIPAGGETTQHWVGGTEIDVVTNVGRTGPDQRRGDGADTAGGSAVGKEQLRQTARPRGDQVVDVARRISEIRHVQLGRRSQGRPAAERHVHLPVDSVQDASVRPRVAGDVHHVIEGAGDAGIDKVRRPLGRGLDVDRVQCQVAGQDIDCVDDINPRGIQVAATCVAVVADVRHGGIRRDVAVDGAIGDRERIAVGIGDVDDVQRIQPAFLGLAGDRREGRRHDDPAENRIQTQRPWHRRTQRREARQISQYEAVAPDDDAAGLHGSSTIGTAQQRGGDAGGQTAEHQRIVAGVRVPGVVAVEHDVRDHAAVVAVDQIDTRVDAHQIDRFRSDATADGDGVVARELDGFKRPVAKHGTHAVVQRRNLRQRKGCVNVVVNDQVAGRRRSRRVDDQVAPAAPVFEAGRRQSLERQAEVSGRAARDVHHAAVGRGTGRACCRRLVRVVADVDRRVTGEVHLQIIGPAATHVVDAHPGGRETGQGPVGLVLIGQIAVRSDRGARERRQTAAAVDDVQRVRVARASQGKAVDVGGHLLQVDRR